MAQTSPLTMTPGKEYVGFVCTACDRLFPIAGPLDVPADKPITVGTRKPVAAECPFCHHVATYTVEQLRRLRAPAAGPNQ